MQVVRKKAVRGMLNKCDQRKLKLKQVWRRTIDQ